MHQSSKGKDPKLEITYALKQMIGRVVEMILSQILFRFSGHQVP